MPAFSRREMEKMFDNLQSEFLETPLKPDLPSSADKVLTNWQVISGAPSCGKTTLIDLLAIMGYQTKDESARQYLEQEMAKGRTLQEIYLNKEDARGIIKLQIKAEQALPVNKLIFLDRAVPDSLAFFRTIGLNPNDFLSGCCLYQYAGVFLLDRLPLVQDDARLDDGPMADYIDRWHELDYAALGYHVIRVPVLPPAERLGFILERVENGVMLD